MAGDEAESATRHRTRRERRSGFKEGHGTEVDKLVEKGAEVYAKA